MSSGILIGLLIAGLAIAGLWIFVISREYRREKEARERLETEILSVKNAPVSQLYDMLVRPALEAFSKPQPIPETLETKSGGLQVQSMPSLPHSQIPAEEHLKAPSNEVVLNYLRGPGAVGAGFHVADLDLDYIAHILGLTARQCLILKAQMKLRPGHEQVIHALLEDRAAFNEVVSMYLVSGATGDLIASWIIDAVDMAMGRQGKEGSE